jgi:hypothetical protein
VHIDGPTEGIYEIILRAILKIAHQIFSWAIFEISVSNLCADSRIVSFDSAICMVNLVYEISISDPKGLGKMYKTGLGSIFQNKLKSG